MKITKDYLRQLIRESIEEVSHKRKRPLGAPTPREIRDYPHMILSKEEQKTEAVDKLKILANAIKDAAEKAAGAEGVKIVKLFGKKLLGNTSELVAADVANHYDDAKLPNDETRQAINAAALAFHKLHTTAETRWERAGMTYADLGNALVSS